MPRILSSSHRKPCSTTSARVSSVASPRPVSPESVWISRNTRSRQRTVTLWISNFVILIFPAGAAFAVGRRSAAARSSRLLSGIRWDDIAGGPLCGKTELWDEMHCGACCLRQLPTAGFTAQQVSQSPSLVGRAPSPARRPLPPLLQAGSMLLAESRMNNVIPPRSTRKSE